MTIRPSRRGAPARQRAGEYLQATVSRCREDQTGVLPPLRSMAAAASVSAATMLAAVRALVTDGVLAVHTRSRIMLQGARTACVAALPRTGVAPDYRTADRRVRDHLFDRHVLAHHLQQRLPPVTTLMQEYGCSYRTINRALGLLVAEGFVVRTGQAYFVAHPPQLSPQTTLVMITATTHLRQLASYTPRSQELWREVDRQRSQRGINLEVCDIRAFAATPKKQGVPSRAFGYLVWTCGCSRADLVTTLDRLAASGCAVALLDETDHIGYRKLVREYLPRGGFSFFTMAVTPTAGDDLARMFLLRGHRRAAFFAHTVHDPCFGPRWEGFVHRFSHGRSPLAAAVLFAADEVPAGVSRSFAGEDLVLSRCCESYRQELVRHGADNAQLYHLDVLGRPLEALHEITVMEPLFRRALEDESITAWVCATDALALLALAFLKKHPPRNARQIAVAGFDDTVEAFAAGLTSYNFNTARVVAAMFERVLYPSRQTREGREGQPFEIPGTVIERRSTLMGQTGGDVAAVVPFPTSNRG